MLHRFLSALLCLTLAAGLAGCAAEDPAPPQEQSAYEYEPPQTVEEEPVAKFELFEPEPEPEDEPLEDEEPTPDETINGFVPDWDAIAQRVDELVEFFSANLVDGITLEDVIKELGREPAEYFLGQTNCVIYRFDLITGPSYLPLNIYPISGDQTPNQYLFNEWANTGYIGIIARIIIPENEDNVNHVSIVYRDSGGNRSHLVSISIFNTDVSVSVFTDYLRFMP